MAYQLDYTGTKVDELLDFANNYDNISIQLSGIESNIALNADKITDINSSINQINTNLQNLQNKIDNFDASSIINTLYPIGSIYTAGNSTMNPNNLFINTTWTQITLENIAEAYVNNYFGTTDLTISTFSDGTKWVPLVIQTNAGSNLFNSTTALQSATAGKMSNLYLLKNKTHDIFKDKNGYYEFYLEYSTCKQRWRQQSNPTKTSDSVTGYVPVSITTTANSWGGLALSSTTSSCYLDGTPGSTNWHYAVCNYTAYQSGIPSDSSSTYCYLYVRVPSLETGNILANDYNLLTYLGVSYWKRVS